jgi:hypothetical protein
MLYVHVAQAHLRELPPVLVQAATTQADPDRRILAMLSARAAVPWQGGAKKKEAHEKLVGL